ncbi:GLPGLI family protein [Tenacibaculum sp. AHE15PA]|uniref:GLPGLI family protein n=1 Tax=unclassified Tenacibaculum TaxID=2635139 RepID=UPI001C4F4C25|nr:MULTISPECIES: GLPGLI family protein [unclassified Tenacibaculum]QXP72993.1 GLPGLI family protein [Tenacibaculum sp. AHE14PA]QXP76907.1 GLPGLI family protein [Tenacibaculum sp. AHE15PA]
MKALLTLFIAIITLPLFSQKNSGVVLYKIVSKKEANLKKIIKKGNLTSFFEGKAAFELVFKGDKSLYKRKVNFNKEGEREKINFFEIFGGSDGVFFNEKGKTIQSVNKYDEDFLITYLPNKWEITQESKKIGGYTCYKAVSNKKSKVVWFTPNIPLSFGPKDLNGLPGLILEVEIGKISIVASEIVFKEISDKQIKKTTKGVPITEKEYSKKIKEIAKNIGF